MVDCVTESPPSSFPVSGSTLNDGAGQQKFLCRKMSPKTPIHPSNGYAVMGDDDAPHSGLADDVEVAASVSQEDESDAGEVTTSRAGDEGDVPNTHPQPGGDIITKRRRRKSLEPSGERRRSLRLQSRLVMDSPMREEGGEKKKRPPLQNIQSMMGMDRLDVDVEDGSNSSRRRSIRILARDMDGRSSTVSKGRRSTGKKSSSKKKRSNEDYVSGNDDALPPPKRLVLEMKETINSTEPLKTVSSASFEIAIRKDGQTELIRALEKIAQDAIIGPSGSFVNVSSRKTSSGRSKKRGRRARISSLETLSSSADGVAIESSTKKGRPKNRRDTFDLSKKRGLSRAKRMDDLNILVDSEDSVSQDANPDYVTPKAGVSEVNVDAIVGRQVSSTSTDGNEEEEEVVADSVELAAVKDKLPYLTSVGIEGVMQRLFPDKITLIYKYPCVSARIFAAMSAVYGDVNNFAPLLPFLLSCVDAELISLKDKEENEPCFLNRRVCFSGFDYSSTTTIIGEVVGQGGGDLLPSIQALETVLKEASKLPRPVHFLDIAIHCLQCMASDDEIAGALAKTVVGFFPSARFSRAIKHYVDELKDVKCYVLSQHGLFSERHFGVRYRLNDFIGRSIRFHLRELLNTIPEHLVTFNVHECEERWGRAVDDGSISSILNYALEKIPTLFAYGNQPTPDFFKRDAFSTILDLSRDGVKKIDKATYESLMLDVTEARSFLVAARACKFVIDLLHCPLVEDHIKSIGGWASVEAIASTFYNLNLHLGSEHEHFAQLRQVRDLIFMLEDANARFAATVLYCESCIRRLRTKFNINTKNTLARNLKVVINGEKGDKFPLVAVV